MGSDKSHRELKQLAFVMIIAMTVLVWISNLYENAKKRSPGPLKSAVKVVERAASVFIAPVYKKLIGVSDHLLAFFDEQVDAVVKRLDRYVPVSAKQFVNQARSMAQKALEITQKVVQKTRVGGPCATIRYLITLFMESIMLLLVRFWLGKLPFAGAIRGVLGAVGELTPLKGVASVIGDFAGAVGEITPVKGVASAVGEVAGVVGGLVPVKGVASVVGGVAAGAVGELKKGVGGVVGGVGGTVGSVTSAVEELIPVKGVAGAVEELLPLKSVTGAAAKILPF